MSPRRILIIDDEEDVRLCLRLILEQHGFEILEADCGEQALSQSIQQPPELILCDLNMPGLGGARTIQAFRRNSLLRDVPIILVTGMPEDYEPRESAPGEIAGYLLKPFSSGELVAEVRRCLVETRSKGEQRATRDEFLGA